MDKKTLIKCQLLINDARQWAYVHYNRATDECILVPRKNIETEQIVSFLEAGAEIIGVVALMKKATPEGKPIIECESAIPTLEAKIKQLYIEDLLSDGTIEHDSAVN